MITQNKLCFFGSLLGDINPSGILERGVTLITYQVRFIFIIRYIDDINDCADFLSLRDHVFLR
jgi:hypothetical protein